MLLALEVEEADRTAVEQELVALLRSAQKLEEEADEVSEAAEHHMTVLDWYSTLGEPEEAEDDNTPLDEQLEELRRLVKENLKSAAEKVCMQKNVSCSCVGLVSLLKNQFLAQ